MQGLLADPHLLAAFLGGIGGAMLGLAARLGRFCTLGAIEDALYGGSDHRLRMWGVATGTAVLLSFAAMGAGLLSAPETPYLPSAWNPFGHVLGGLLFGYGMALAGNCGYGALARLGGGDLRSFVLVVVLGISAYFAMSGPLAALRVAVFPPDLIALDGPAGIAHWAERSFGLAAPVTGMAVGLGLLAFCLASRSFRSDVRSVAWGAVVGIAIGFAWTATQWLATHSFDAVPVTAYTFARPVGEAILYAMTASGATLSFGIGSVAGVWCGAFLGSLIKGHFRWEACEDPRELRRQIFGATMMGVGAVLAVGCSVGQGLSAMSVLSFGAPLTLAAIFAGAALGLRHLIHGFAPA